MRLGGAQSWVGHLG